MWSDYVTCTIAHTVNCELLLKVCMYEYLRYHPRAVQVQCNIILIILLYMNILKTHMHTNMYTSILVHFDNNSDYSRVCLHIVRSVTLS